MTDPSHRPSTVAGPDVSRPGPWAIQVAATTLWTEPDAVRDLDAPIVAARPDPRGWAAHLDTPARADLVGRVLSQLLLGEPVDVIAERGDWLQVVALWQPSELHPRGYPGWVPRAHVGPAPVPSDRAAVVAVEAAPIRRCPGGEPLIDDVSYATVLPALEDTPAGVRVGLPGGRDGWLDPTSCVVYPVTPRRQVDGHAVLAAARRFVGLEYLWGGLSAFGLDCSGLVHLSFRALGRIVPRDAHDQAEAATRIGLEDVRPGDAYFFAHPGKKIHHVGLATGDGLRLLHAPQNGRRVSEEEIVDERLETLLDQAGVLAD
ncbi:C40 family peptidase [Thermasporomyces composti]|jgi:hypothetical protein|uniref:NlpC/P60 family protein n=1 Tax=Thermasporomyces composti TaxID=696763 RepID=A0A3D9V9F4_THECX|nr:C40 family peptidase [Thermasporomyces composti]REF38119.1 NlpC/P60 family protein [Thermasporomyces composti]